MKTLAPLRLKQSYYAASEQAIVVMLRDLLFMPLIRILRQADQDAKAKAILSNASREDKLADALRVGRVQYTAGVFSGEFSAAITTALRSMGAVFDSRSKVFRIEAAKVPTWIKAEAAAYNTRARDVHEALKRQLSEIRRTLEHDINVRPVEANKTVDEFEKGFSKAAKALEVQPELDAASREKLAREYSDNIKLYIKNFADDEVLALHESVEKNAMEGYRFDKLIPSIKKRYGVTVRKAKFLARNETSIFMSKYHEERYAEAGVTHYIWSTSHDQRVRPAPGTHGSDNHRVLDGRVFAFAQPPTVDPATGRKANPGQDYNCRCIAIPVLDDKKSAREEYARELAAVA